MADAWPGVSFGVRKTASECRFPHQLGRSSARVSLVNKAGADRKKTARAEQGYGHRLTEHLLCFHGKPRERRLGSEEKFFCLFVTDFPLQAEENCVSLRRSKRRGTFQGITERGT